MMSKGRFLTVGITIALLVSCVPALSHAATHTVGPGQQYQTIQGAIDAAANGDTVLIYDGVYTGEGNKNIDFKGKAIEVSSAGNRDNTIIDCEKDGRGFIFQSGEGANSKLSDITIRNAKTRGRGGGILCKNSSSPTIRGVKIESCFANMGGAICAEKSSPEINNCFIQGCGATKRIGGNGGGIAIYEDGSKEVLIMNCSIKLNKARNGGGGIYITATRHITHIRGTTIARNSAETGGGVRLIGENVRMENCIIVLNVAINAGGGVYAGPGSTVLMDKVYIEKNLAEKCSGGGIYSQGSRTHPASILFARGRIAENQTKTAAGGGVGLKGAQTMFSSTGFFGNKHFAIAIDPGSPQPIVSSDCQFSDNSPSDLNY